MNKLAGTVFESSHDDSIAAVDVYSESFEDVTRVSKGEVVEKNSIGSTVTAAADTIRKSNINLQDLTDDTPVSDKQERTNNLAMLRRVKDNLAQTEGLNGNLENSFLDKITENLTVSRSGEYSARVKVGDSWTTLDNIESLDDAKSVTGFINGISSDKNLARVLDLQTEMGIASSIIETSIALGIPGVVDEYLDKRELEDEKAKRELDRVLSSNALTLALAGDIEGLIKVADRVGTDTIMARHPTLLKAILAGYRFPESFRRSDAPGEFSRLTSVLTRFSPMWDTYERDDDLVTDLTVFTVASRDAETLFITEGSYRTEILMASSYPSKNINGIIRNNYPYMSKVG